MKIRLTTIAFVLTSLFASQYAFAKAPKTVAASSKHSKHHKKSAKKAAVTPATQSVQSIA